MFILFVLLITIQARNEPFDFETVYGFPPITNLTFTKYQLPPMEKYRCDGKKMNSNFKIQITIPENITILQITGEPCYNNNTNTNIEWIGMGYDGLFSDTYNIDICYNGSDWTLYIGY